jgi:naphthoate synthase
MTIAWRAVRAYEDITYQQAEGIARIAINRPAVRNAFRPQTVMELIDAFSRVREAPTACRV